ncbi:MAG: DNA polymerase III subunit beta [Candidatus Spechtbacteria bacterium]|nr:DNA polymerase III subunit beta [Candidatus Spechtbacteria bacterium]
MEFTCTKNKFFQGIQLVERVCGRNTTLPILQNILIRAEQNRLVFIATDLEVGISAWVSAKVQKEGVLALPAHTLSGLIRTMSDDSIIGAEKKQTLIITGVNEGVVAQIKGDDPTNYPLLPKLSRDNGFNIEANKFAHSLERVIHSLSVVDTKPELTGILVKFTPNSIICVATDSFRLAENTDLYKSKSDDDINFILPMRAAQEIIRIFQQDESISPLVCYLGQGQVLFEYNPNEQSNIPALTLISRLIDGDYPDYIQIIPKEWKTKVIISKSELLNTIKSAGLFANKLREIGIRVLPAQKCVEISTEDYDRGSFKSRVSCNIEGGEDQDIVFNYQYLLDGLQPLEDSDVIVKIKQKDGPIVFEPSSKQEYRYIVMPLRK